MPLDRGRLLACTRVNSIPMKFMSTWNLRIWSFLGNKVLVAGISEDEVLLGWGGSLSRDWCPYKGRFSETHTHRRRPWDQRGGDRSDVSRSQGTLAAPAMGRGRTASSQKAWPCCHLDVGCLASGSVGEKVTCFKLPPPVVVVYHSTPRTLTHSPLACPLLWPFILSGLPRKRCVHPGVAAGGHTCEAVSSARQLRIPPRGRRATPSLCNLPIPSAFRCSQDQNGITLTKASF